MASAVHCNISTCEQHPSPCDSELSGSEWFEINVIIITPILIAIFAPIFASRTYCQRDDDVRGSVANPTNNTRSSMLPSVRLRETDRSELPGQENENAIDPPMFCCGAGLLPLHCGTSGLMVIIFIMVSAFVVTFYTMLAHEPCTTGLGKCRTISCICGNVYEEGYVFMFSTLSLTSLILVQRFSSMFHRRLYRHKVLKAALIVGSLLLTLTGIFPERYNVNDEHTGGLGLLYCMHLIGVYGSMCILLGLPYVWFTHFWVTHRGLVHGPERVHLSSLLARSAFAISAVAFGLSMSSVDPDLTDQVTDFCGYMTTKVECEAWPRLTASQCHHATQCIYGGMHEAWRQSNNCDSLLQPNFKCKWRPDGVSEWTSMFTLNSTRLPVTSCVKHECPVFKYARSVALEFAVLFIVVCYVSSFALHDVKRLLARVPTSHHEMRLDGPIATGTHTTTDGPLGWPESAPQSFVSNDSWGQKPLDHTGLLSSSASSAITPLDRAQLSQSSLPMSRSALTAPPGGMA